MAEHTHSEGKQPSAFLVVYGACLAFARKMGGGIKQLSWFGRSAHRAAIAKAKGGQP